MHTVRSGTWRVHFNSDLSGDAILTDVSRPSVCIKVPCSVIRDAGAEWLRRADECSSPDAPAHLADADVAEILERTRRATPGPWDVFGGEARPDSPNFREGARCVLVSRDDQSVIVAACGPLDCDQSIADAKCIAHARTDLERLARDWQRIERERIDALVLANEWRDAIQTVAPGCIPTPRAARHAISELYAKFKHSDKENDRLRTEIAKLREETACRASDDGCAATTTP